MAVAGLNVGRLAGFDWRYSHGDKSAVLVLRSPLKRTGVSVADEIEKELDEALVRAERLRQSVLKSAFEGRLV